MQHSVNNWGKEFLLTGNTEISKISAGRFFPEVMCLQKTWQQRLGKRWFNSRHIKGPAQDTHLPPSQIHRRQRQIGYKYLYQFSRPSHLILWRLFYIKDLLPSFSETLPWDFLCDMLQELSWISHMLNESPQLVLSKTYKTWFKLKPTLKVRSLFQQFSISSLSRICVCKQEWHEAEVTS